MNLHEKFLVSVLKHFNFLFKSGFYLTHCDMYGRDKYILFKSANNQRKISFEFVDDFYLRIEYNLNRHNSKVYSVEDVAAVQGIELEFYLIFEKVDIQVKALSDWAQANLDQLAGKAYL